jgi:hypothetical protein
MDIKEEVALAHLPSEASGIFPLQVSMTPSPLKGPPPPEMTAIRSIFFRELSPQGLFVKKEGW